MRRSLDSDNRAAPRRIMPRSLLVWIAAGLGSGFFPFAPGTAGSVVGLVIGIALWRVSLPALVAGIAIASAGGFLAIKGAIARQEADADPGWIVIDEIAGQMLTLVALRRLEWRSVLLAFVLFRLFDILKPGPVGWADRQGGAAGIMADDVVAGALAALCVALLLQFCGEC